MRTNGSSVADVTGFHDSTGNDGIYNQNLARRRTIAVRKLIQKHGITNDRIAIQSHGDATGSGSPKGARRVEVAVKNKP